MACAAEQTGAGDDDEHHGAVAAAIVLDVSAFYPGGGGQPADTGRIAGLPVGTVQEDPARPGVLLHVLAAAGTGTETEGVTRGSMPRPGDEVQCELDWDRRYGLMQQHTGQHIISALALAHFGAETTGFHLGEDTATVDLAFPATGPAAAAAADSAGVLQDTLDKLERLVAAEVFANRPVRTHLTAPGRMPEGAAASGLEFRIRERGPAPKGTELWRVVEIAGVDLSPCGGTHVAATGEAGPVSFERWERIRDSVRLEFLCGWRALAAHARRGRDVKRLARELSVHEREAVEQALRGLADAATQSKRLAELAATVTRCEAAELSQAAEVLGNGRLVVRVVGDRPAGDLKLMAGTIAAQPGHVALLASSAEGDTPRLVFARAADVDLDLRSILAAAIAEMGGRGGGTPALVQGGGGDPAALRRAMDAAAALARRAIASPPGT